MRAAIVVDAGVVDEAVQAIPRDCCQRLAHARLVVHVAGMDDEAVLQRNRAFALGSFSAPREAGNAKTSARELGRDARADAAARTGDSNQTVSILVTGH